MSELLEQAISLEEAAAALRIAPSTLRRWAAAGIVPGYKPGKRWAFLPSEIAEYRKASRPKCPSIDVATLRTGGLGFRSKAERSASPLAREIAAKRKNSKPRLVVVPGGKRV